MAGAELWKRLAVALVGVPAVVVLLYLGGSWLSVPVAVLAALGAQELYTLAAARGVRAFRTAGMLAAGLLVLAAGAYPTWGGMAPWALALVGVLVLGSLVGTLGARSVEESPLGGAAVTVAGVLYAGLPLAFIPLLRELPGELGWVGDPPSAWAGVFAVAFPIAVTWVGDAAAYFVGTAWGRKKLAPSISPKKSWVGSWGGLAGAGVAAGVWHVLAVPVLPGFPFTLPVAVGLGVLLGVGAQVGDLVESLLKREAGVKDSGTLFPGHGGVLDRLDALCFTLPLAYLVLALPGAFQ
jgi:phosphatidate cytidylyltransferase